MSSLNNKNPDENISKINSLINKMLLEIENQVDDFKNIEINERYKVIKALHNLIMLLIRYEQLCQLRSIDKEEIETQGQIVDQEIIDELKRRMEK